jgi:hydroxymethylpyrimidine/phosphomethylpyrimidine kinase
MLQSPPIVLTIAGFDPSSGAGITADIKTIAAHGCYGVAAITALTVQSTQGVRRVSPVEPTLLRETLNEITSDVQVAAVRVGMLGSAAVAAEVAEFLKQTRLPHIVLDTVLTSTSGAKLLADDAVQVVVETLFPLAEVITPNAEEAAALTGTKVEFVDDMRDAAKKLQEMGAPAVVITGGHLDKATDLLTMRNGEFQVFKSDRQESASTHGTGCAFSAAIASHLALDRALPEAVLLAKAYVTSAIANAYPVGKGIGPVNHMYRMKNHPGGLTMKLASGRD